MPSVKAADGIQLHYDVHGDGPTGILFLHGMGGTGDIWHPVVRQLDQTRFRAVTIDLRGHGKSRGGEARFNFAQLDEDLWRVADAAGIDRGIVVAHSGSGKNALWSAVSQPNRLRGVVIVAPCGIGIVPLPRELLQNLFNVLGREKRIPAEFAPWFTEKIGAYRAQVDREYAATPRAVLDTSAELWAYTSVVETASRVTQPVHLVVGLREPLYHLAFQREHTIPALPAATVETFDCAHFIPLEEPVALAAALVRFATNLGD